MQNKTSVRDAKRQYYKINWLERIAFGSGDMAQNFVYQTFTTYLLFFYTNIYHLDARIAATIFLVVRIINGVWDPIVGALVDRVTLPFGKYRGWMLFAVGPLCLLMILCFIVPELHPTGKIIYACATYIGVSMIYTVVNVPFGALNAALTRDPHEITILTTVRMWLVNLAQILVTYGVPNLVIYFSETHSNNSPDDADAWLTTALIFSAAGFIALLFSYFGTKEKVVISKEDSANIKATDLFKEIARNRPLRIIAYMFITTFAVLAITNSASAYFVSYNMGNSSGSYIGIFNAIPSIPALLILPFVPRLRAKLGKKMLLYISLIISILGFIGLFFVPANNYSLVFAFQFIRSAGFGITGSFIWTLIPEAVTFGEWKSGRRVAGITNALIGFFYKFGLALGGFVPGMVLSFTGFIAPTGDDIHDALIVQPDIALWGIRWLLAGIPIILCFILIFIVSKYNLTDKKLDQMNLEIEKRRNAETS